MPHRLFDAGVSLQTFTLIDVVENTALLENFSIFARCCVSDEKSSLYTLIWCWRFATNVRLFIVDRVKTRKICRPETYSVIFTSCAVSNSYRIKTVKTHVICQKSVSIFLKLSVAILLFKFAIWVLEQDLNIQIGQYYFQKGSDVSYWCAFRIL